MRRTLIVGSGLLLATWLACSGAPSSPPAATSQPGDSGYEAVMLALPKGDARAGRQAFLDLKCTACHKVADETGFPEPFSDNLGPELDLRRPFRSPSEVATAIVAPSHSISSGTSPEVKARLEGELSPMGDFSQAMTVRQLADMVEYLRTTPPAP
jgi:mono/diheme cytochrome c family protein